MLELTLNKLRSRKGASLTFALLAFLVCAVISAVLLAAAQTAAGRVSGLAEADQRYYAVSSAAQLFCDALGKEMSTKQPYKFEWTESEEISKWWYKEIKQSDGSVRSEYENQTSDPHTTTYSFAFGGVPTTTNPLLTDRTLLKEIAMYYAFGEKIYDYMSADLVDPMIALAGLAFDDDFDPFTQKKDDILKTWKLQMADGTNEFANLTVDVEVSLMENGNITLIFKNYQDPSIPDTKTGYSIRVDLAVTGNEIIEDVDTVKTVESDTSVHDVYQSTETETKITTRKLSISWEIGNITKVYNTNESTPGGGE